jgi:restriction system protein
VRGCLGGVMAKRRGFIAEVQYQSRQADKRRRQKEAAAKRARVAAQRESERAQRAAELARAVAANASRARQFALQQELERRRLEARLAEVEELNANLAAQYAEIDSLLTATLDKDKHLDLTALKITTVDHPPFEPGELAAEIEAPPAPQLFYAPVWQPPTPSFTVGAAFRGRKHHEQTVAEARAAFEATYAAWARGDQETRATYSRELIYRDQREKARQRKLADAQAAYRNECEVRTAQAGARNAELDKLINGLAFDVESAIDEYAGIVLANSVYPDAFPVDHDHAFTLQGRELTVTVTVPEPAKIPAVKEYKHNKPHDEIATTELPVREKKGRYANAVWQVAVRTLNEVFETDRAGKIHSIALVVGVEAIAPATGLPGTIPLVIVAADREAFTKFDLSNVVPKATLEHLGAALSKSPFDLTPADTSRGVRASRGA